MNINPKMSKPEVIISASPNPNDIFTNSRIKIFCSKSNSPLVPINFVAEWKKIGAEYQQIINNHENSQYECNALDVGHWIETRIKYEDDGVIQEAVRKFGPVKIQPELAILLQKPFINTEIFKIKLLIENNYIDINLMISNENVVLVSKQNYQYPLKSDNFPNIQFKHDVKIVSLRLKSYSQTATKYIGALLKKFIKYKIDNLDLIFESRSKRDYFLILLKKILKRNSTTASSSNSAAFLNMIEENRNRDILNIKKTQTPITNPSIPIAKKNSQKLMEKQSTKQEKNEIKQKSSKTSSSGIQQNDYLNIFQGQNDLMKDLSSNDLFSDFTSPKTQPALNLRQSFVQLQQMQLRNKSDSYNSSNDEAKGNSQQSRNQIKKLMQQVSNLKDENTKLKQQIMNFSMNNKQLKQLKLKIQYLSNQNQRLQKQRTQIISDKINIEMKYQKQKQEKQFFKNKFQALNSLYFKLQNNNISNSNMQNSRIQRQVSKSPIKLNNSTNEQIRTQKIIYKNQNTGLVQNQNSRSNQNLKRLNIPINPY